ncbi:ankyrin repeat-containing protein [Heterostelium album PN500]|uniref:Ankyrin repeat-containing protein n=1 Tax=Heterostelium pallidum (strain ATCC 26659 / Pp 5 / PN500) TaxID=670386 RepID=D3BBT3_HETP5|nr:ankyrin repeat-containing protein [Heterostelium album PN500]EFA81116.1 ankyrin repeat-containing protein [Heterostelium album PN500]|eukprot:XP_020433234.1 ankyrin repeat-containing protein [Heterostelium album PN500]
MSLSRIFGLIPSYDQLYLPDPEQQFVWGWNNEGQLGVTMSAASMNSGGDVVDFKTMSKNFVTKDVAIGLSHTLLLSRNGEVYAVGKGKYGRLGNDSERSLRSLFRIPISIRVLKIAAGSFHSAFITEKHQLFTFGRGDSGQLGHNDYIDQFSPKQVSCSDPIDLVACGSDHTVFVTFSCGTYHTNVLTAEGLIYSWGTNDYGQVSPDTRGIINVPQRLRTPNSKGGSPIMNVYAGGRSSMAIRFYPTLIRVRESTYKNDIENIFTNNTNTDCEVILKDKSGDEEKTNIILSHKIFLTRSSLFSDQLDSNTIDVGDEFESFAQLNSFITKLYKDDENEIDLVSNHLFLYINNPLYSDVKICVKEKAFYAHKCILVARSNKLKVQLESFFQEGINNTIFIDNVNPDVYYAFIHYLYTDKLNIDAENAIELLFLAHEENLERMLELVQEYLINGIDDDNVSPLYDISTRLDLKSLGDQCLYYIAKNIDNVSKTETFSELPEELKKKLISSSVPFSMKKDKEKNCILINF